VLILVIVLLAAAAPSVLIIGGMTPADALSTAAAVAAFAFGVTHQLLHMLGGPTRRTVAPVNA
jgi:hypothetical protein